MTPPCKDCPDRTPGCHAKCGKYAEYVAWNEERKRVQYLDSIHPDGARKVVTELMKKQRK